MNPVSVLREFAKGGVVIEGRGAKVATAALAVMAAGMSTGASALPRHRASEVGIPYHDIVLDVRTQVEAEFPGRIFIVDRSKDPRSEAARLAKLVGIPKRYTGIDPEVVTGDPHSAPFDGTRKTICVVVGAEPWMTSSEINGVVPGMTIDMGALDDATAHKTVLWHEVGHCLLGASEARADAFGALKVMSELKSARTVEPLAVVRELSEWLGPPGDEHHISQALREVIVKYDNPDFYGAKKSLKDLVGMARKIGEPEVKRVSAIRDALAKTRFSEDQRYFVPVREGYVATSMFGWLKASSSVPEFRRITELSEYLTADPAERVFPAAFKADPQASATAMADLAAAGDPVARRVAPAFGVAVASADAPIVSGDFLPSGVKIEGRMISFDRASAVVKFSKDFRGFLVRDAGTNRPLLAGNASKGVTKTFGPKKMHSVRSGAEIEPARRSPGMR